MEKSIWVGYRGSPWTGSQCFVHHRGIHWPVAQSPVWIHVKMHHVGWFKSSHFLLDPMCLVSILVFLVCTNMLLVNINSHDLKHKQSWFIAKGKS